MRIPTRLDEKIRELSEVQVWVHGAIADFEPWLKDSNFVFFPDYTDHGTDHVEQILITASSIIRDQAWDIMTPEDAGILVIATLLHDCAMHLTEEGFLRLINCETHQKPIEGFNDALWPDLWKQFFSSAKRYDNNQLQGLFGDTEPVENPIKQPDKMTRRDRKLIGEFLRRYHPRLAHEIALYGVPSPGNLKQGEKPLQLPEKLGRDFADIAGLVARSHGMSLRATFDYLKRYDLREYGKVHGIFLMSVLRIADYLQIQSERAPQQTLRVKDIRSSISRREWDVHQSIRGIRSIGDDPEAIFIQTEFGKPDNVETYLRLKEWLNGIQSELDACWAVFGEIYARTNLQPLGLMLRRVRSNLDDEKQFAQSVQYVPKRIRFEVARSEVLQRLVGPLYGDIVEVGIRELVQNAVDAVRELDDCLRDNSDELKKIKNNNLLENLNKRGLLNIDLNEDVQEIENNNLQEKEKILEKKLKEQNIWERAKNERKKDEDKNKKQTQNKNEDIKLAFAENADVVVVIQEPYEKGSNGKVIVCDRGIGMTEKIITDYFLRVGASFRNSDSWAEQHEDKPEEQANQQQRKSRVARSGYFGVGALAAYLLGDKIKVSTRHFTEDKGIGIEFEAKLGDESIELHYSQKELPVGTTIEISLTKEIAHKLLDKRSIEWDWYCLDKPKVIRLSIDKNKNCKLFNQEITIPLQSEEQMEKEGWHQIEDPSFKDVYWNFIRRDQMEEFQKSTDFSVGLEDSGRIICNGIRAKYSTTENFLIFQDINVLNRPTILVIDTDRKLHFNLTRFEAKVEKKLFQKVKNEFIKYLLALIIFNSPLSKTNDDYEHFLFIQDINHLSDVSFKGTKCLFYELEEQIKVETRHTKFFKSLILYTSNGILINDMSLINKLKIKSLLIVYLPRFIKRSGLEHSGGEVKPIGFISRNYFNLLLSKTSLKSQDYLAINVTITDVDDLHELRYIDDKLRYIDYILRHIEFDKFVSLQLSKLYKFIYKKILNWKQDFQGNLKGLRVVVTLKKVKPEGQKTDKKKVITKESFLNCLDEFLAVIRIRQYKELYKNKIYLDYEKEYQTINWIKNNCKIELHQEKQIQPPQEQQTEPHQEPHPKKQTELAIFTIGECPEYQDSDKKNWTILHKKIAEISEDKITVFRRYSFNDNENYQKALDDQETIITIELFLNEIANTSKLEDGSIASLWLQTIGEKVIPYKKTDEYEQFKKNCTPLSAYIKELENLEEKKKEEERKRAEEYEEYKKAQERIREQSQNNEEN